MLFREVSLTTKVWRCTHRSGARKIVGVWVVVYKRQDKKHSRLFLEQNNFVFAVTALPGGQYYRRFRKLKISDYVSVSGWLKEKATLEFIRRCTWVAKNPKRFSEDNLQYNCSARYGTDNSSSDVTHEYKRK